MISNRAAAHAEHDRYYCVLLCTAVYYCVLLRTTVHDAVYYCDLLCAIAYYCVLLCTVLINPSLGLTVLNACGLQALVWSQGGNDLRQISGACRARS